MFEQKAIEATPRARTERFWLVVLIVAFLLAVAPTLSWLEFSGSMENLNVATALEMRRGGPWLLPTLEGRPRVEKPPLTAWVTAGAVAPALISRLDDPDGAARDAAYRRLAFRVRLTALLAAALTLLATFALGTTIADARTGLLAAAVCASCFFFLRFGRSATTDTQLMLWVTVANLFLARLLFGAASWWDSLAAGAALGLAFMTKGPVALVHTLAPALLVAPFVKSARRQHAWPAIAAGAVVMFAVGLWWFVIAAAGKPSLIKTWLSETNPAGGERLSSSSIFTYSVIVPFMIPWSIFMIDGLIRAAAELYRSRSIASWRQAYPAIVLITALIIMSCFHDRKERYILPLVPIAAIVAAQSVRAMLDRMKRALPDWVHWAMLLALAPAPLLGASTRFARTADGQPWFGAGLAIGASAIAVWVVIIGMIAAQRHRGAMIVAAVMLMLLLQATGIHGYARSREGRSEMRPLAELIRRRYPDAEMYNWRSDGVQKRASVDLSIYLNRVTRWIRDPAILPPGDRPQIAVTIQQRGEPDPLPPDGWSYLHKVRRDKDWYVAFVRDRRDSK